VLRFADRKHSDVSFPHPRGIPAQLSPPVGERRRPHSDLFGPEPTLTRQARKSKDGRAPQTAPHDLLVNDTQEILDLMTELLEEGYRLTISLALLDIEKVKDLAPEIIVHDLLVEQTQELGWKFLRQVRLDPELARIPLILCTASVRTIKEPDWRAPGAQAVPDRGLALRHRRGAGCPDVDHRGDRGND